jgi:putative flippase GtrA
MDSFLGLENLAVERPAPPVRRGWRSLVRRLVPAEAVKYAIVGFAGIGVNLVAMAAILDLTAVRDWRASLLASVISTMNNYVWNNFWTFRRRAHSGLTFLRRYVIYLAVSLVGMAVTTITYAMSSHLLSDRLRDVLAASPVSALLLCQLFAVLAGTLFNYLLNRTFTWPHPERQ